MAIIILWFINALALIFVSYLLPGVHVAGFGSALIAAVVLGLVNTVLRPILIVLTIPVTLITFGLPTCGRSCCCTRWAPWARR